jgi:hypothetical protein
LVSPLALVPCFLFCDVSSSISFRLDHSVGFADASSNTVAA